MNKVDFTLNNGRVERMHPKIAQLLQRKGKGTYQTTAMQETPQRAVLTPAAAPSQALAPEPAPAETPIDPGIPEDAATTPIDLASMSVEELREYAKRQGVQVHHRAGANTILKALNESDDE